jgi:hydrogenase nickel incorporation protein HypA/HybF
MHETMVAQSLLAAISAQAAKHNARPISAKISCGRLYSINEEILCFAFEAVAKGTPCEGVKLVIEQKPLQAKCRSCEKTFEVDINSEINCPECKSNDLEMLPDSPLLLEEIELEEEG